MNPEVDLSAALGDVVRGAERVAAEAPRLDASALVAAARRRRQRATTAVAAAALILATGGVGLAATLDVPPDRPAATPTPAPDPTEPAPVVLGDPETGSVGAAACGLTRDELPWRPDDRMQIGSDEGPQLRASDLRVETWILSEEGHYRVGSGPMDAVAVDASDRVVAYLTEADAQTEAGVLTGVLVPCEDGARALAPGTYELVVAYAFREVTASGEPIDTSTVHGTGSWELVVPRGSGTDG